LESDAMNGVFQFGSYQLLAVQRSEVVTWPEEDH